jgi:hypothetical protein
MIEIYGSNGRQKCQVEPGSSSRQDKALQSDNVLSLSFTHYAFLELDVNDWCYFEGERYWLQEKYLPKQKSLREWEYNVKLYGIESLIKRLLVLNSTDGENEAVFTLTAPASEHVRLIVRSVNDGMDSTTNWKVGEVLATENLTIDYEGTYCDEGLRRVAEAAGTEWWIEGETVNLCRCEHGEELTLGYGESLTSLDRDEADGVKFYTRLFPIGSSRNIDRDRYGYTRLQLPGGAKYVDLPDLVSKYGIFHHFEQEAFSDIYPRRVGVVDSVRHEDVKDADGKPFTIYYFRDSGLTFDPNEYEIGGLVKHVVFQSGELDGRDFEVNYHSGRREFEIITIWPYDDDTQLPGGFLVPKSGDKYILYNIRMPDEYYGLAEREYEAAVEAYNQKHRVDASVYKASVHSKWVERTGAQLYIGRRVRLESEKYFPDTGYRCSRITRVTRKVSDPCQVELEIGDAVSTGTMTQIEDSIHDVKVYVREASGSLPDVIRSWDTTRPTDNNLYSARRSHKEFLSKNSIDRAKQKIIFDEGIEAGDFEAGVQGGFIDGTGNAELLTLVVRQLIRSARFVDGFGGEGWQLWIDGDELSNLTIDRLTVRQVMTVFELLVEKLRSVGGQIVVSAANGKIKTVEESGDFYIITFEQENTFMAHDLMRCQTFTGGSLKSYWAEVAAVSGNSVLIAKSEFDVSLPSEADECVLMGNTVNTLRQNLILISATEDGHPRIDVMDGVKDKNFTGCLRARLGSLDGISDDYFPVDNQPHGNGLYCDNAYLRGTFLLTTGEDIKTKFEITEGKIESSVTALRQDFAQEKGFLNNPSFDEGLSKWLTENETVFWLAGNKWIWANQNVLTKKGDGASVTKDDGRVVVRIKNKYITQKNTNLRSIPTMETNASGKKEAMPVYLSFLYRCASAGTLHVRFENVNKTGFENFNSFDVEEWLSATDGYKQYNCNGLWNGTGDFKLSFTGDIYLYMLILSTDKIESLTYKYRTLFEQSDKLVKIAAQNFDQDGNVLEASDIITTSKYNVLISQRFNEDGSLKNVSGLVTGTGLTSALSDYITGTSLTTTLSDYITGTSLTATLANYITSTVLNNTLKQYVSVESFAGMFVQAVNDDGNFVKTADLSAYVTKDKQGNLESGVHVGADHIALEGLVTANSNFKILADGSMEAANGKFGGQINAKSGYIGGFVIGNDHIGVARGSYGADGSVASNNTTGLFLYDDMIGFNGNNRQAIFGTWNAMGQPMLCRIADTGSSVTPKYGIVFDIRNSMMSNLAFCGTGNGALNGFVEGYKYQKVAVSQSNTIYELGMSESNRILVNCTADNSGVIFPKLRYVRNALGIGTLTPFAVHLIVMADLGSNSYKIYGRNTINANGNMPWNDDDYPLFTSWDGTRFESMKMGEGDTCEVLLVYDPDRSTTLDGFDTKYTARVLSRQY